MSEEGMGDALPEVESIEPAPAEEPQVKEPEAPEVDPLWLDEPAQEEQQPQYQQQQPPPPQQQQYYQQPVNPAYPQQYKQQQQPYPASNDAILEQFLQNPNAVIQQQVQQQLNSYAGPMASRILEIEQQNRAFRDARANEAIGRAKQKISDGYNSVLNKDEAFRGDESVKRRVEDALKTMHTEAVYEARATGNYSKLDSFSNPLLFKMTLIAAKELAGYKSTGAETMGSFNQGVESANPRVDSVDRQLPADLEAAAYRLGSGGKEQLIANWEKYGDRISFE